jgi:hypothetical protein
MATKGDGPRMSLALWAKTLVATTVLATMAMIASNLTSMTVSFP